jgi:hypothetical protein
MMMIFMTYYSVGQRKKNQVGAKYVRRKNRNASRYSVGKPEKRGSIIRLRQ